MDDLRIRTGESVLIAERSTPADLLCYLDINDSPIWLSRANTMRLRDWLHELLSERKRESETDDKGAFDGAD